MGISETFAAFQNAWYTVASDGLPPYRINSDGSKINSIQMAQYANQTTQQFNLVSENPYIPQDRAPLAYA